MKKLSFSLLIISIVSTVTLNAQWSRTSPKTFLTYPADNVGMGISTPLQKLHLYNSTVNGTTAIRLNTVSSYMINYYHSWDILLNSANSADGYLEFKYGVTNSSANSPTMNTVFKIHPNGTILAPKLIDLNNSSYYIDPSSTTTSLVVAGNVGIGCTNPTVPLAVNGKIWATEIEVKTTPCSDFVFETDYKLKSISEVEQFVKANKHLPDVPSANEFKEKGSYSLNEMDNLLLQKVEELTLYIIEQNKKINELENRLNN